MPVSNLNISSLEINDAGLFVRLNGHLKSLQVGSGASLQNPSRLTFFWHNYRLLMICLGLLFLGLLLVLVPVIHRSRSSR